MDFIKRGMTYRNAGETSWGLLCKVRDYRKESEVGDSIHQLDMELRDSSVIERQR